MKLTGNGVRVYISDESDIGKKIKVGYNYDISASGEIILGNVSSDIKNKYQALRALKGAKTVDDLKIVLEKILTELLT